MKKTIPFLFFLFFISPHVKAQAPLWNWVSGGTTNGYFQTSDVIATDPANNICIAGSYIGDSMYLGNVVLANNSSPADMDIFLAYYDYAGNLQWAENIGGAESDLPMDVAMDDSGNVYLAGDMMYPGINIGSTFLACPGSNPASTNMFLAKYNAAGVFQWALTTNGSSAGVTAASIACDQAGHVYVLGDFLNPFQFGAVPIASSSGHPMYLAKFDRDGNCLWGISPPGNIYPDEVACDKWGNPHVSGVMNDDSLNFNGHIIYNADAPHADLFIVKYNSNGMASWAQSTNGTGYEQWGDFAIDTTGNVYMFGQYDGYHTGNISIGSVNMNNQGIYDLFLVKMDSSGTALWGEEMRASNTPAGRNISCDSSGFIYLAGSCTDSLTFDSYTITGAVNYITKYDPNGIALWVKTTSAGIYDLTNGANGAIDVTGVTTTPTSFDAIPYGVGVFAAGLSSITGTSQVESGNHMLVYPNPAYDFAVVELPGDAAHFEIYNSLGQLMFNQTNCPAREVTIPTYGFPPGIYSVRITTSNGFSLTEKFAVAK